MENDTRRMVVKTYGYTPNYLIFSNNQTLIEVLKKAVASPWWVVFSLDRDQRPCPLHWEDLILIIWHCALKTVLSPVEKAIVQWAPGVGSHGRN